MALIAGTRLGPYEIVALLGSGGMGEVYRARDKKLDRDVAIKVLPELLVADPERVARFQREAKTLASLNHPHIGGIYGFEDSGGVHALVLELVEGPTLADRIAHGPIAIDEALPIAKQIAEALEAAHEAGIIHRDLKPANIKLRHDGTVKVLDFGLAKALAPAAASSPNVTASPTITTPAMMTGIGVILGTAAYMSPEQAKGRPADKRSDVWAFGCVLYEMLTGKRPFEGEDVSDTLAAILKGDPDWHALPDDLPASVWALIRGCLTKDRRLRIGDISTALFLLRDPFGVAAATGGTVRRPRWTGALALAVVAVAFTVIGAVVASNLRRPVSAHVVRIPLVLPQETTLLRTAAHLVALSPDGTKLVYIADRQLFLRRMSELESRPVQGATGDIAEVFFSPDGEWVGFLSFRDNLLKKIAVTGGAAVTICKAGVAGFGARWDRDQILFEDPTQGIMRVAAAGGEPSLLLGVKPEEGTISSPQFIDHGKAMIFTLVPRGGADRWDRAQTIVQSLETGERKVVLRGGTDARYVLSGHIIYAVGPNILAVPFDPSTREVKGGPVPVIENVMRATVVSGNVQLAVSDNGVLAYIPGRVENTSNRTLAFVDRAGKIETVAMNPAQYEYPRISPDGRQIAVAVNTGNQPDIWIYEIASGRLRRLTYGGSNSLPIWSRDGRYVVFASERANGAGLYRHPADGTGGDERLTTAEPGSFHRPFSVDPSGETLAFGIQAGPGEQTELWTLSLGEAQNRKPSFVIKQHLMDAAFSPDGRWLAFAPSLPAAERQIFVQPYPDLTVKHQITAEDGREPMWTPDGKQLVYVRGTTLNVVDIRKEPAFSAGAPVTLPIAKAPQTLVRTRTYDITPDGKRFVVVVPSGKQDETQSRAPLQINVVLNWQEELKQRVPTR